MSVELRKTIKEWQQTGRDFIYWDRGYARRVFATWLPRAPSVEASFYRWEMNAFQMKSVRDVPSNRWEALATKMFPWKHREPGNLKTGHIVVAEPSPTYRRFHEIENWTNDVVRELQKYTDRELVIRDKESPVPLFHHLNGAHALVTHGSIAAVEAVVMGCPVFVDGTSAAKFVGLMDLSKIENPVYPDREKWAASMAYSQYNEDELVDGTLWRLIG